MTNVKRLIGRVVRKLAPETMLTLEYASNLRAVHGRLPEVLHSVDDLRARLEKMEGLLAELDGMPGALDEVRGESLRIAELTDLVVTALGALPVGPDGPRVAVASAS